ncbi:hypothetical protein JW905_16400 [bacterium]|nr:hypothetical protein [candidate division CSSED10-310 bacterium]
MESRRRRMQFVSDALVRQVTDGRKTASVTRLGEVDAAAGEYDDALVVGEYYDVYDSRLVPRATIRITAIELCHWDLIPERLWRGEANTSEDTFRRDHKDYFDDPDGGFEFVAYYFELVQVLNRPTCGSGTAAASRE